MHITFAPDTPLEVSPALAMDNAVAFGFLDEPEDEFA
jgi:hypothetical protein